MKAKNYLEQYKALKAKHSDVILLFRTGDFYLCYGQDAIDVCLILKLDYSRTTDGTEIAGFPHHALDAYLPKLNRRVAICESLDEETSRSYKRMKKLEPQTV